MKVFKFGGASVKDAEGVKNVSLVLETQGFENCLLVVSAMGKTTNALEKVVQNYFDKKAEVHGDSVKSSDYFDDESFFTQRSNIINWWISLLGQIHKYDNKKNRIYS